jgi:hypothetical protein
MLFETVLIFIVTGIAIFFIGIPFTKLVKAVVPPPKKDPLVEAKVRLELARKEKEAALLNKETDQLYQQMLDEIINNDSDETKNKLRI